MFISIKPFNVKQKKTIIFKNIFLAVYELAVHSISELKV